MRLNSMLRDVKTRGIILQVLVALALIAFFYYLFLNTLKNLDALGVASGFGFLSENAGFDIPFSFLDYDISTGTHGQAFIIGLINTLLIAVLGIVSSTIIGFLVGIMRLSNNLIISTLAAGFVEFMRNIPLLLHILLWYFAIWLSLPNLMTSRALSAINLLDLDLVFIHNRGINLPSPIFNSGSAAIGIALLIAIVAVYFIRRYGIKLHEDTGRNFPVLWASLGVLVGLPLLAAAINGFPVSWDIPVAGKFNMKGGAEIPGSFFALWAALSLYTGAFIAENVRSGILAVNKGQLEASIAVGLSRGRTLRFVTIPQALRVIIPPVTSHYLNLAKNSSLAVAIGFPEIISIAVVSSLNIAGQAIEIIFMTMLVYISISLIISLGMNIYNNKIRLVER